MEIKNIKKMRNGKYNIELDNNSKILTYDDVILKNKLLYKKKIDNKLLEIINNETSYYDIYMKLIKYISVRMRSKKEIVEYLEKNKVDEDDKNRIINDLINNGLLNDEMFAGAYISDKVYLSNNGRLKIKQEILKHDINEEIIDNILYSYNDEIFEEKLNKLINKKIKASKYSGYILKQKIFYEFNNLGYENYLIEKVYNSMDNKSNIDEYFQKYYNNLSKKYSGNELKLKLKNKLYSRGYTLDEINEKINTL